MGLFCQLFDDGVYRGAGEGLLGGLKRPCFSPNSMSLPSSILFFSSSAIVERHDSGEMVDDREVVAIELSTTHELSARHTKR